MSIIKELTAFLHEANKRTYADKDAQKTPATRLMSEDYHFEKDEFIYHDTYFGGRNFIGEEIVYRSNKPCWGMNYYGYILSPSVDEKIVYNFLREALMQEYSDILPVRGGKKYQSGEWLYTNTIEGGLDLFTGIEEIHKADILLYRACYHGGFIE